MPDDVDVEVGDERLRVGRLDHDHPHAAVGRQPSELDRETGEQLEVEQVDRRFDAGSGSYDKLTSSSQSSEK
ncbi:MAG: hypothetical protein AAGF73_04150 [Actinomycetota bacterium]